MNPYNYRKSNIDRREGRRVPSLKYLVKGARKINRRKSDVQVDYFIDAYSPKFFMLMISILLMSVLDYIFTLIHLSRGAVEFNPIMNIAIQNGTGYFFFTKYSLTVLGLLILCLYKNFFPTKRIVVTIFSVYLLLTLYHISCLMSIH